MWALVKRHRFSKKEKKTNSLVPVKSIVSSDWKGQASMQLLNEVGTVVAIDEMGQVVT